MTLFAPHIHPPKFIRRWFPDALWTMDGGENAVFLTFDDGPVPEATPLVLEILEKENAKATFFCVGENVFRYPEIYQHIMNAGHSVGNHTYNHLQGLKTGNQEFFSNIEKASHLIDSNLFRPPHGLMKPRQYSHILKSFKVVMWDIVSMDYRLSHTPEIICANIERFVEKGSIITFHDSVKTIDKLKSALPLVIKMLKDQGFQFRAIPFSPIRKLHLQSKNINSYLPAS
jgi:peptidoglycan-N-acetylglucosamine deacetylase